MSMSGVMCNGINVYCNVDATTHTSSGLSWGSFYNITNIPIKRGLVKDVDSLLLF